MSDRAIVLIICLARVAGGRHYPSSTCRSRNDVNTHKYCRLIAIMLARLKMNLTECMDKFKHYTQAIFGHRSLMSFFRVWKYSEKALIRATKMVVGSFDPGTEAQKWKRDLFAAQGERCKWYVF